MTKQEIIKEIERLEWQVWYTEMADFTSQEDRQFLREAGSKIIRLKQQLAEVAE